MKQRVLRAVTLAALLSAASFVVGVGSVAHAATGVGVSGDTLRVTAAAGKANDVTVTTVGNRMIVRDLGDLVPAGGGCTVVDTQAVSCPGTGVARTIVNLGDGNDFVVFDAPRPGPVSTSSVVIEGGPGTDLLRLGALSPAGELRGGPGGDTLRGGPRNDVLDGGEGADGFLGGPGVDQVTYGSRTGRIVADLDGVNNDDGEIGERDTIRTDVESIRGGSGDDDLFGGVGNDVLIGGPGNDDLFGLDGNDQLIEQEGTMNGGLGGDTFVGGPTATVSYADRSQRVSVSVDDVADDGFAGENDNVRLSVVKVVGGSGDDLLTSYVRQPPARTIDGGPGNDLVDMRNTIPGDVAIGGPGQFDNCPFETGDFRVTCEGSLG